MTLRPDLEAAVEEVRVRTLLDEPLYHVTYYGRLANIAEVGLQPNRPRSIGAAAYDAHAKGKTFLTEPDGVGFWMGRAEAFAEHNSDNPLEDGLVPVVLRVAPDPGCLGKKLVLDGPGTRDANADAWTTTRNIFPDCLDIYTGSRWAEIDDWEEIDPAVAFNAEPNPDFGSEDDEYGDEPEFLHFFKLKSPLEPDL